MILTKEEAIVKAQDHVYKNHLDQAKNTPYVSDPKQGCIVLKNKLTQLDRKTFNCTDSVIKNKLTQELDVLLSHYRFLNVLSMIDIVFNNQEELNQRKLNSFLLKSDYISLS